MQVCITRRALGAAMAAMLAVAVVGNVAAAATDSKTIRLIVPYGAGGATDFIARQLAEQLSPRLGATIVVENRPGADGVVGTGQAARAKPDGSTYLLAVATHLMNPFFHKELPYDTFKSFDGVTLIARSPVVLLTQSAFPAKDIKQFVDIVRKSPDKYSFGNAEKFTMLVANQFASEAGLDVVHVPYNGAGPMLVDVAGGSVTAAPAAIAAASPYLQSGRLRALAVTGAERAPALPDVPTLKEAGIGEFDLYITYSMYAPAGTPRENLERMQKEIHAVVNTPKMKEVLGKQALTPVANSVDEFNAQQKAYYTTLQEMVKRLGLK